MQPCRLLFTFIIMVISLAAYSQQQDVDFHLAGQFLTGKQVLKVKRDFNDPFVWVLAAHNEVYRINSGTMTVDDYTAQFSQYNNFQFIDIAGADQDNVFVATSSTDVIAYNNGVIKTIGVSDGLTDPVNSVGISNFSGDVTHGDLEIGTSKGRGQYNIATGTLRYNTYNTLTDDRIYEATYRNLTAKENSYSYNQPSLIPVSNYGIGGGRTLEIAPTSDSGPDVSTALGTGSVLLSQGMGSDYETGIFWGNEHGLFEESPTNSYQAAPPYNYYLQGIKVNKITDILGFSSLGGPYNNSKPYTLTEENLLVGTDKGLYFSSSIYGNFKANSLHAYSMFHYDILGNIVVNDICVNSSVGQYTDTPQGCEDGVWIACNNGLYYIKPDYAKYLDPTTRLQAVVCDNLPYADNSTTIKICEGETAKFRVTIDIPPGNSLQWVKDGVDLPGKTSQTLEVTAPGDYYAVIYASCENVHIQTNHFTVQVITGPVFSFNYPDKIQNCNNDPITLQTDNNPAYTYRWYTNGVLNGETSASYTVTQSGKYKVEVSACSNSWVPSKEIEVDLIQLPVPVITADKTKYCAGDNANLAVNIPVDPGYTINWYQDGNLLPATQDKTNIIVNATGNYTVGIKSNIAPCTQVSALKQITFTPAPAFSFNYPDQLTYCAGTPVSLTAGDNAAYQYRWYKDGVLTGDVGASLNITRSGKYHVEVSACEGSWVPSKQVQVDLVQLPVPVIQTDKPTYCIGDNARLSVTIPSSPDYIINWYKDNVLLPANTNQTSLTTAIAGQYMVSIINKLANTDGSTCAQSSAVQPVAFNTLPTVSIQKIIRTTLCDGQPVDLKVNYSGGSVKWSTGESDDQITVSNPGTYTATVTSPGGCPADASIDLTFLPNPVLNIPGAGVCPASNKTVTLTAPSGMASYTWNGKSGTETYVVNHPQTVSLSVTDANGCQATQDIQVTDECPAVTIPNTFTPNGDGINDTWQIAGLEYDQTAIVKIFSRYGQSVYQSKAYAKSWDGTANGKQVPAGVYYYIITAKNNTLTYSGSLTIIY